MAERCWECNRDLSYVGGHHADGLCPGCYHERIPYNASWLDPDEGWPCGVAGCAHDGRRRFDLSCAVNV